MSGKGQKGEPMEWIVESESLSDFVDHGWYTITSKPLIRCKDCEYFIKEYGWNRIEYMVCSMSPIHTVIRKPDDFCSRGERRTDE